MPEIEQAMFLAAGQGMRLGRRGEKLAKGLLPIGDTTLIERAIALLRQAGIREIVIVTGHLREQYEELASRLGGGVHTVFNPDHASHGASRSLAVGLEALSGPLLMLEADVVWEARALTRLLAHRSASTLLVSGVTGSGDEVWTWTAGSADRPVLAALSKRYSFRPDSPYGELVGLIRIDTTLRARLRSVIAQHEAIDRLVAYETCLAAAAAEVPVDVLRIDDLSWGEIDDETMYARVRDVVWPSIEAVEKTGAPPPAGATPQRPCA